MSVTRVAILLPNLLIGGAERVSITFAAELVRQGFAVDLVLMEATGPLLDTVPDGVRVVGLDARRRRQAIGPLRHYLRESAPIALYANVWPLTLAAAIATKLAGAGTQVVTMHQNSLGSQYVDQGRHSRLAMKAALRLELALATKVVGCSTGVIEDLARLAGVAARRFRAIPNPVRIKEDVARSALASANRLWGVPPGRRILAVGNLKAQKNHALLLDAFAAMPRGDRDRLIIIGEGELRGALEAQVRALGIGLWVVMPGQSSILEAYYRTADLFVLSSRHEGLPTVLIEALGFGLPIVATDCPSGPREILANGRFGTLVPMDDAAALTRAMELGLSQPVDRDAMRSRARDFAPDAISRELLGLLDPPIPDRAKRD